MILGNPLAVTHCFTTLGGSLAPEILKGVKVDELWKISNKRLIGI
ncbi:MAG: hypothetical protein RLZZ519_1767 [Bacteroidota bacterium]|jgi:hypothetical protein